MKQLVCEMCGSTDIIKEEGVFICQYCGCKYSVEEARKMMVEGTVEIKGTVKIDSSDEIKKLYQAARNARDASDNVTALKHYEAISAKDPNSWEALLYLSILKTNSIKNGEINSVAINVANSVYQVFQLINDYVTDEEDKINAIKEVLDQYYETASWLTSASNSFYKTMTKGNGMMALTGLSGMISSLSSTGNSLIENSERCFNIATIMINCGDAIEYYFNMEDDIYKKYAVWAWKKSIKFNSDYKEKFSSNIFSDETLQRISSDIKKYNPNYKSDTDKETEKSSGCYIATAVYGSYDCPQVWTLRRFRDYTLAETWYGRFFIHIYYAVSPTLVKWFGQTEWFKNMWKAGLDRMVANLNAEGVENTPYEDRSW